MIQPRTISQMIAASALEATKAAIVAELGRLLLGVKVVGHPGKLDINDVAAKSVVAAPGVAVGWTRTRADRQIAGNFAAPIEWAAYIVTEDYADQGARRRIERDSLAHGIGSTILEILHDPDASTWGLTGIGHPLPDPAPALTPVFTARSFESGAAYYAVTWTQPCGDQGRPALGIGPTPDLSHVDRTVEAVFDESDGIPAEILALMRRAEEGPP